MVLLVSLRRILAANVTAIARRTVHLVGHRGTSLPGMIARRIDPSIVSSLAADLGSVVFVVGTNGKTTTARLTSRILESVDGTPPLANRSGANLRQGIASAVVAETDRMGRLRKPGRSAVFEVDELALVNVIGDVVPTVLVILNLFRDQLDRMGEVETVIERRVALRRLPRATIVVSCADDSRVDELVVESGLPMVRFGLAADQGIAPKVAEGDPPNAVDAVACPVCGAALETTWRSIGHLGDWACPNEHVRRTFPDVAVGVTPPEGGHGPAVVTFHGSFGLMSARVHLGGYSAAYDSAAAVTAAIATGIAPEAAIHGLDGATPAFGRLEEAWVDRRRIVMALVKNPASMTESVEVAAALVPDGLLLGLSDEPADGRDVSWIWDVDLEPLRAVPRIGLTGTRRDDMAIWLKYAPRSTGEPWRVVTRVGEPEAALVAMLAAVPAQGTLVVLATYTSLLGIRSVLEQRGVVPAMPR
jgi:UDP-N-acetylmuramyl tripeptide synthase